jgi:hypothetical protein
MLGSRALQDEGLQALVSGPGALAGSEQGGILTLDTYKKFPKAPGFGMGHRGRNGCAFILS